MPNALEARGQAADRQKTAMMADLSDAWSEDIRRALGTVGHNRSFGARELIEYLNSRHRGWRALSSQVHQNLQKLRRSGYVGLDSNGYHVTKLGWDWIEGAERGLETILAEEVLGLRRSRKRR